MKTSACTIACVSALMFSGNAACGGGGGGDGPTPPVQPVRQDSTSVVVGPSGGAVTTPNGEAGVQIPAGVLGSQATITVTKLPAPSAPNQGPLPTTLNQYGPFYQIAISPANAQLGDSVRVGVCQVTDPGSTFYAPEATHSRLRLAHTVGSITEILEPVSVTDFLRCTNVTADVDRINPNVSRLARALAAIGQSARGLFSPRAAYAAHGGLGGKVKSFSPFGAVDPLTGFSIGFEFSITATPTTEDDIGSVAFDGTNYLVALDEKNAQGQKSIDLQFVSATGTVVGNRIVMPASTNGQQSRVAFDGTNYLVVWSTSISNPAALGQFVNKSGTLVGGTFPVAGGAGIAEPGALVFGGGTYFMAFSRPAPNPIPDFNSNSFGRLISTSGVVGGSFALSTALTNGGFNSVAFDGTNFLAVYTDGSSVRGRFVSTTGVMGSEATIFPSGRFGDIVTVGFNGTNYLVTAPSGDTTAKAVAQLISPSGARIGGVISIASVPGVDEFPVGVWASGGDFIVSYIDNLAVSSKVSTRARFVSGTGTPRGPSFSIASPANGKVAVGYVTGFAGGKYFAILLRGVPNTTGPLDTNLWTQKDVSGVLFTATIPPP